MTEESAFLTLAASWAEDLSNAGRRFADLAADGHLRRGLRDVLTHHIVFSWNRLGLPYRTQAVLAGTAKLAIFGPDPTAAP